MIRMTLAGHFCFGERIEAEGKSPWKVIESLKKSWNLMEDLVSVTQYDLKVF